MSSLYCYFWLFQKRQVLWNSKNNLFITQHIYYRFLFLPGKETHGKNRNPFNMDSAVQFFLRNVHFPLTQLQTLQLG